MLIYDFKKIGNRLLKIRKKQGFTQSEVAESAGMSDRTYADIERGNVNMRVETLLQICNALHITPDEILTEEEDLSNPHREQVLQAFDSCSPAEQRTALQLLSIYLNSVTH